MENAVSYIDDTYRNDILCFPNWVTFGVKGALLIIAELVKPKGKPCRGSASHVESFSLVEE